MAHLHVKSRFTHAKEARVCTLDFPRTFLLIMNSKFIQHLPESPSNMQRLPSHASTCHSTSPEHQREQSKHTVVMQELIGRYQKLALTCASVEFGRQQFEAPLSALKDAGEGEECVIHLGRLQVKILKRNDRNKRSRLRSRSKWLLGWH